MSVFFTFWPSFGWFPVRKLTLVSLKIHLKGCQGYIGEHFSWVHGFMQKKSKKVSIFWFLGVQK